MELALVGQVWLLLMVLNVVVAGVACGAARLRDRSPVLVTFCALLLGILPPLNLLYLAALSLLPPSRSH